MDAHREAIEALNELIGEVGKLLERGGVTWWRLAYPELVDAYSHAVSVHLEYMHAREGLL